MTFHVRASGTPLRRLSVCFLVTIETGVLNSLETDSKLTGDLVSSLEQLGFESSREERRWEFDSSSR